MATPPVIPTGLPAWTRTASHEQYGGNVNKRNFLEQEGIDPQTDVDAEHITRIAADLAAIVNTAPFALITFLCSDTAPISLSGFTLPPPFVLVEAVYMQTGVQLLAYPGTPVPPTITLPAGMPAGPPPGFPSVARNGTGDVTVTFAEKYSDAYGTSAPLVLRAAGAMALSSEPVLTTAVVESPTTVRVRATAAGVAKANTRVTLEVF